MMREREREREGGREGGKEGGRKGGGRESSDLPSEPDENSY